jgi:hypothetical protein
LGFLQSEDSIGWTVEDVGEHERKLEAWYVSLALDRVDALPRDPDSLGELLLGPAAIDAQLFYSILDTRAHVKLTFRTV